MPRSPVTSGLYAAGSYGHMPRKADQRTVRIWSCGATVVPQDHPGHNITPRPCTHPTRSEAEQCPRRPS
jgi:hypothetical protein